MDKNNKPRGRGTKETTYCLTRERGEDGTRYYTLLIRAGEEECRLPDIGRTRTGAMRVRDMLVRGRLTPYAAREVVEELLARDPDIFC